MTKIAALAAGLMLTSVAFHPRSVLGCEECQQAKTGTIPAAFTLLGNGTARTWVTLDPAGKPTAIGVTLSETALSGLLETPPGGMEAMEYTLSLPKQARATGFDHVNLDWNPKGHVPSGIYDVSHFDVHFYLINRQERARITAAGDDLVKCNKRPEARFIPAGYLLPPGTAVPRMGAHWVDPRSPEFHKQPFTRTFL
jgi:hypothetical protein